MGPQQSARRRGSAVEQKAHKAEFDVDLDSREVIAYAASFGNVDEVGDVLHPGAFQKSIEERFPQSLVKFARDHGPLIGTVQEIREDERGLWTRSKFSATPLGDETLTLVKDGAYSHFSFQYTVRRSQPGEGQVKRHLLEVDLFEVGPVAYPANRDATILAVKSLPFFTTADPWTVLDAASTALELAEGAKSAPLTHSETAFLRDFSAALPAAEKALRGALASLLPPDPAELQAALANLAASAARWAGHTAAPR